MGVALEEVVEKVETEVDDAVVSVGPCTAHGAYARMKVAHTASLASACSSIREKTKNELQS